MIMCIKPPEWIWEKLRGKIICKSHVHITIAHACAQVFRQSLPKDCTEGPDTLWYMYIDSRCYIYVNIIYKDK